MFVETLLKIKMNIEKKKKGARIFLKGAGTYTCSYFIALMEKKKLTYRIIKL